MNHAKSTALTDFTEELSAAYHLNNSSFSELYSWHYFDISAALKKEIIENLNSLSPDRFNVYIEYINNKIHEEYGYYNPDKCIIGKWIDKFDLKEEDFPFDNNNVVTYLLSVNKENHKCESKKQGVNIKLMQLEFHWYAGHLEYLKMKSFIDGLLPKEIEIKSSKEGDEKMTITLIQPNLDNNPYPRIFTSSKAYKIFENLKSEFGVTKIRLADYSYIYHKMLKDGYIYDDYKQTEFVFFLLYFDINIDRIKPWTQIGSKNLRDKIYNKAINQSKSMS